MRVRANEMLDKFFIMGVNPAINCLRIHNGHAVFLAFKMPSNDFRGPSKFEPFNDLLSQGCIRMQKGPFANGMVAPNVGHLVGHMGPVSEATLVAFKLPG